MTQIDAKTEEDNRIAKGTVVLGDHFSQHRIKGDVHQAVDRGLDPRIDIPLISHVESGLWQGGCMGGVKLPDEFDFVLSLYPWEQYRLGPDTEREEIEMLDSRSQGIGPEVEEAAWKVHVRVREGQNVLVHCQAGLNRSGLLTARVLMLRGYTAREALDKLRAGRHPLVVCNTTFEQWLLGMGA